MSNFSIQENSELNQYWYNTETINILIKEIEAHSECCAFLSTPSLYFSTSTSLRNKSSLFDIDLQWKNEPGFIFFDYNKYEIPENLQHKFDYVVCDPPFISEDVWKEYAKAIKLLLKKNGKLLLTSIIENHTMLENILTSIDNCKNENTNEPNLSLSLYISKYCPSIPSLTYQYFCFINYTSSFLELSNKDIPISQHILSSITFANDMRETQETFKQQMINRDRTNEKLLPIKNTTSNSSDMKLPWNYIPEGLSVYPNGSLAMPKDEIIDYGPVYNITFEIRENLENFKKLIDEVMHINDKIIKNKEINSNKENFKILSDKCQKMNKYKEMIVQLDPNFDSTLLLLMVKCQEELSKAWQLSLEKFRILSADCTREYKSKIFNKQKHLLKELKNIKKGMSII